MHIKRLLFALTLICMPLMGGAQTRSENWELMGVRLGMTEEAFLELLPTAICEKFSDGQTSLCNAKDRALAGKLATLTAKFLDGKVIHVSVWGICIAQALAASDILAGRYGSPNGVGSVRTDLLGGDNNGGRLTYKAPYWKDGNVELFLKVDDWYSKKKDTVFSAIILQDIPAHNGIWVKKYNGVAAATEI